MNSFFRGHLRDQVSCFLDMCATIGTRCARKLACGEGCPRLKGDVMLAAIFDGTFIPRKPCIVLIEHNACVKHVRMNRIEFHLVGNQGLFEILS